MRIGRTTLLSYLADTILLFLASASVLYSLDSAYQIGISNQLLWLLGAEAPLFALLSREKKYRGTIILVILLLGTTALAFCERAGDGFRYIGDCFYRALSSYTGNSVETLFPPSASGHESEYASFALGIVFTVYTGVLSLAYGTLRSFWMTFTLLISVESFAFLFLYSRPALLPVLAFSAVVLTMAAFSFLKKENASRASASALFLLPVFLFTTLMTAAAFPQENYRRFAYAERLYAYFAETFHLRSPQEENSTPPNSVSSDPAPPVNPFPEETMGGMDLLHADPSVLTGKTVITVTSDRAGVIFLRGLSAWHYNGRAWSPLLWEYSMPVERYGGEYLTSYTLAGVMHRGTPSSVTILPSDAQRIVYFPYFARLDATVSALPQILHPSGVFRQEATRYAYTVLYDAVETGFALSDAPEPEKAFRKDAYRLYTDLTGDAETDAFLRETASDLKVLTVPEVSFPEYQQAVAESIASYVRESAVYSLQADSTPVGTDYVRYFLTESRRGYCVHFATAATMLLRAAGIPARFVTGYVVTVSEDDLGKQIAVPDRNAHAWVEYYLDGTGWLPIDVTPPDYAALNPIGGGHPQNNSQEESSEFAPVSREETTVESSSAISFPENTSISPLPTRPFENKNYLFAGLSVLAVLLFGLVLFIRRRMILNARKRAFASVDFSAAGIAAWQYLEKLSRYGVKPEKSIYALAQKAAFSASPLSEEERDILVTYAQNKEKEVAERLSCPARIAFRYFRVLG